MIRPNRVGQLLVMLGASAGLATCLMVAAAGGTVAHAQAPAAPAQNAAGAATFTPKVAGTLLQIMRGVMFPESNVVFAGQNDVSKIPQARQAEISTDLLTSAFGGWQAVENSALGLAVWASVHGLAMLILENVIDLGQRRSGLHVLPSRAEILLRSLFSTQRD